MRQSANIGPQYAIRPRSSSGDWYRITALRFQCSYTYDFTGDFLAWERPEHTRLTELQPKLRCTLCGNREDNTLTVRALPRD